MNTTPDSRAPGFETQQQAASIRAEHPMVQKSIDDPRPGIPHDQVMARMEARIAELKAKRA